MPACKAGAITLCGGRRVVQLHQYPLEIGMLGITLPVWLEFALFVFAVYVLFRKDKEPR